MWHKAFEKKMDKWIEEGKLKDYDCHCTDIDTSYTLKGLPEFKDADGNVRGCTLEDLGLVNSMNLSNMTVVNEKGMVATYRTIKEFQQAFYDFRMPYYYKRKEKMLVEIENDIKVYQAKIEFIEALRNGKLVIDPVGDEDLDEEDVIASIKKAGLNVGFYKASAAKEEVEAGGLKVRPVTPADRSRQGRKRTDNALAKEMERYEELNKIKPETMWINDLRELRKQYVKDYDDDERTIVI
jgi:DNA topoisomerase-2